MFVLVDCVELLILRVAMNPERDLSSEMVNNSYYNSTIL